jgi:hypothetical protein
MVPKLNLNDIRPINEEKSNPNSKESSDTARMLKSKYSGRNNTEEEK